MDDDEINLTLYDPTLEKKREGLIAVAMQLKHPLLVYLKSLGVSAREDQEDIVFETFAALHERALAGKIDLNQSPKNFLFNVAHKKKIDMWRKRRIRIPNADDSNQSMANELLDNSATQQWHELNRRGKTKVIFEEFLCEVPRLPKRQAQVAIALSILFAAGNEICVSSIRDTIESMTGEAPPLPSIKSAWEVVRQTLRERIEKEL